MNYWERVCEMQNKQTKKGIEKYGQVLECNQGMDWKERITYLQEELIDGLMYCEHIKELGQVITANEYQKLALRTASEMSLDNLLVNGALGLGGESGEVLDSIKKHKFQGHELDKEHIKEELGDVMWYIAAIATSLDIKLTDIMQGNIDKLKKRYPNGFESERSKNR